MCKIYFLIANLILLTRPYVVFSQQNILPGAVEYPIFWIKAKHNKTDFYWENLTGNPSGITQKKHSGALLNFNPSIALSTNQLPITLPLGTTSQKRHTLFLVYKAEDSIKEQFLWTITDAKKTQSLATTKRLVDLRTYAYQTYPETVSPQKANIHFFQQHVTDSIAKPTFLTIGQHSKLESLPPEAFKGHISEILVYNRILSGQDIQKIASYLSIKYGISLLPFGIKNYLNSQGETIWELEKHKDFSTRITAVGRDDASGLRHLKSSNMTDEGLLTLELSSKSNHIPNTYFAFWSDNGQDLLVKKQEQGEPIGISRAWQLDFSNPTDLVLDWVFNPNFIKGSLPKDTYYWLLVDYSGTGNYNENDSEYIRLASTSSREKLVLRDFNWDKHQTGKTKFTIKIAPELFSRVWITEASCDGLASGALRYTIEGGQAPYTITVKKTDSNTILKQWTQNAKTDTSLPVSSGNYTYIVRDAKGRLYSESVFVADKEGTFSNLKPEYLLSSKHALVLDASTALTEANTSYMWYYEGTFINNTPKITIDQAGDYELRLRNDQGCYTSKKIKVISDGSAQNNASTMYVYPNPAVDGHYNIALQFPSKTNAIITIYSPTGALLKQETLYNIEHHMYTDTIKATGMYMITVVSNFGTKTLKLIIE
ncbi:T9SS type A sorting domain-containing protein [Mariniflexile ostreae]|uniref:T9SS type A sorting domain-containing protein n=1 Tax=Mariniflexile ostreae TaxID=1520892 RepID=A0ABV5FDH5_9FLAO